MDRLKAEQERIEALKAEFRRLAEANRDAGKLSEARNLYKKILELDPNDQGARDSFLRLSTELGDRGRSADEMVEVAKSRDLASREQARIEIQRRLEKAQMSEQQGRYDDAVRYYEEIRNVLKWYPYQADFPVDAKQVDTLLAEARRKKELDRVREEARINAELQAVEEERRNLEREQQVSQMRTYLKLASDSYERGDYDQALTNAQRVLALDPRNEMAQKLVDLARETKYVADRNRIQEEFSDQWREVMERLELDALPVTKPITFPRDWLARTGLRGPRSPGAEETEAIDPRTTQIMNVLETRRVGKLAVKPGEISLDGVVGYLRSVTGENFVISQKAREDKGDVEIELDVKDISVTQVLELITEPHELAWKIRNGVVMILTKEEAVDKPVLRFYDVKDLVAVIRDFPGQEINLFPSKYTPPEVEEGDEPEPPFNTDSLIEVIRNTIESESWDSIDGAGIESKNNVLVVTTTPEIHRKVAQLLDDLREHTGVLVNLEVRFLTAEDRFLRDVGVDVRGLGDQTGGVGVPGGGTPTVFDDTFVGTASNPSGNPLGVVAEPSSIGTSTNPGVFYGDGGDGEYKGRVENLFDFLLGFDEPGNATASANAGGATGAASGGFTLQHTFLDDVQLEVILRAVEKSERIQQISAPRLTVYNTQRANVSVLTQNSYVQDFDVEIAQAAAIGDPIIQTIRDGIILDVRPIVSADRRFITMELRPTVAQLVRPIPTFLTSLATGPPVTIQVPEIAIQRVRTTVTTPDSGILLLGGIKFFRDVNAESGLPILNKIPIISFLFTRKAKSVQRRNLLILIKASVVIPEEHEPSFGAR